MKVIFYSRLTYHTSEIINEGNAKRAKRLKSPLSRSNHQSCKTLLTRASFPPYFISTGNTWKGNPHTEYVPTE